MKFKISILSQIQNSSVLLFSTLTRLWSLAGNNVWPCLWYLSYSSGIFYWRCGLDLDRGLLLPLFCSASESVPSGGEGEWTPRAAVRTGDAFVNVVPSDIGNVHRMNEGRNEFERHT